MQTGSANLAGHEQRVLTEVRANKNEKYTTLNSVKTRRFVYKNDPRISQIFGNNLSFQRDTFRAVGIALLILMPLIAWGRYQLGYYHSFTTIVVLTAMAGCVPAIFSSLNPKFERYAGHLLLSVLTGCFVAVVLLNGGLRAPILVAAPLLPLAAAFLLGPSAGVLSAVANLVFIAALVTQPGPLSTLPAELNATFLAEPLAALANGMFVAVVSVAVACVCCGFNRRFVVLQEELLHLATHDPLTNLANRKSLESALFNEARKRRTTYPVSLIVFDIDHFKRFNDNYGHQAGDQVLKAVAEVAHSTVASEKNVAARYGGDEFVVVLPNTGHDVAMNMAEQIRSKVEKQHCKLLSPSAKPGITPKESKNRALGHDDNITLSIGVATYPPGQHDNPYDFADDLMARADAAMYRSKQAGGNQVSTLDTVLSSV